MPYQLSRSLISHAAFLALFAAVGQASGAVILYSGFEGLTGSDPSHFDVGLLLDGHSSATANPLAASSVYVTPDPAPSWSVSTFAGGTMNPSASFMPPGPLGGQNVGYSGGAILSQVIPSLIEPSTTYILSVGVGHPIGGSFSYRVWLSGDGFELAADANSVVIPSGAWGTSAVVWNSPGDVPSNSRLTINLASDNGTALFDNVQVTAETLAPEPSSCLTLIIPALAFLRRRRLNASW